jgi:hypothetical protein
MSESLIDKLISQHDSLKKLLGKIKNETVKDSSDFTYIFGSLKKFKKDLLEHIDLENNDFYAQLLERYKDKESDFEYIKKFQGEMDELADEIYEFIEKYTYKQKIERVFEEFKKELDFIISSLQIRVSSEEEGVFLL